MKKKAYIAPEMEELEMFSELELLATSLGTPDETEKVTPSDDAPTGDVFNGRWFDEDF